MKRRVLAIGLDGYEESLERQLLDTGALPALRKLRDESARFLLDHGAAQRSGLAWEHVSTGMAPERSHRWAAVHFDPETYDVWQEGTRLQPFPARLDSRTVVFDTPYFDLQQAPATEGIVGWGAHDPGVPTGARPPALLDEFLGRFGAYPADDWIYGHVWASPERTRLMGERLANAIDIRTRAAQWLFGERLPDWDLALMVASEPHSAIEGLWHGVDPGHPLHREPSARFARDGLIAVYRGIDRMVGTLAEDFPDCAMVVFCTGGMGPNRSDVPSMFLTAELLYRHAFGRPYFQQPQRWTCGADVPSLGEDEEWAGIVNNNFPRPRLERLSRFVSRRIPGFERFRRHEVPASTERAYLRRPLHWIPATRYRAHWPTMRAFALPSFYDGRVRINLQGRERAGRVPIENYASVCSEVEALLRECRDPSTGESCVDFIERPGQHDPRALGATEADLVVTWKGHACAFDHPRLGRIGPIPFRRPGGHTGVHGLAYLRGSPLAPGDFGVRSAFDVAPTLCELLGEASPAGMSGKSLLAASRAPG